MPVPGLRGAEGGEKRRSVVPWLQPPSFRVGCARSPQWAREHEHRRRGSPVGPERGHKEKMRLRLGDSSGGAGPETKARAQSEPAKHLEEEPSREDERRMRKSATVREVGGIQRRLAEAGLARISRELLRPYIRAASPRPFLGVIPSCASVLWNRRLLFSRPASLTQKCAPPPHGRLNGHGHESS